MFELYFNSLISMKATNKINKLLNLFMYKIYSLNEYQSTYKVNNRLLYIT